MADINRISDQKPHQSHHVDSFTQRRGFEALDVTESSLRPLLEENGKAHNKFKELHLKSFERRKVDHRVAGGKSDEASQAISKLERATGPLFRAIGAKSPTIIIHKKVQHVNHPGKN